MTEQNKMTYQDAHDLLISQIYAPVFFDKLANDYGIRPSTEEEAREFLVLSGKLEQLHQAQQAKQANERASLVSAASQSLDSVLSKAGVAVSRSPTQVANDEEVKAAAVKLSQVPQIRDAALLYQDAMRQMVASE